MKGLKNIGLSFFFLLIFSCSVFASVNDPACCNEADSLASVESVVVPVIYSPVSPVYLEIELTNFAQTISEVHKLVSVAILPNRVVPLNYDFRSTAFIPIQVNFNSPVPIFIKGHSLRN